MIIRNLICTLMLLLAVPALAQPVARTEIYAIQSVTLTQQKILSSELNGPQVTITGVLRIPTAGSARLPAVLLVHGSGGIGGNLDYWARELNSLGIAVFTLDSFTGRGIVNTTYDQSQLDHLAMMVDAYRALALLAKHPRIDPARIVIMGFSKGAVTAVYSANTRFQKLFNPSGPNFAAHIGLYTPCTTSYRDDDKVGPEPIRLFHGAPDDWVPVGPCREYVARLKKAGADVSLTEYPGAFHQFDNPLTSPPIINNKAIASGN